MNWSAKSGLFALVLIGLLNACEVPKEIGLPPGALVDVKYVDTLTVKASTVLLDSIRTVSSTQMLVGSYQDPQFGKISSQCFFEYAPPSFDFSTDKTYQYDSVAIQMSYSYLYGDTLQPFEMNIHRLVDTLAKNKTYYNYDKAAYDPKPYSNVKFTPTFGQSGAVRNILPDDFGRKIFGLFFGSEGTLDENKFIKAMKGFAFIPSPNNKSMIGFPANGIQVLLFFHENGASSQIAYPLRLVSRRFNNITADRKGTQLSKLVPLKATTPEQLGGLSYVQDAVGIVTKLEIPYLSSLSKEGKIAINRAELSITPELTNGFFPIPNSMFLAETDETNRVLRSKSDIELLLATDETTYNSTINPQPGYYSSRYNNFNFTLTTYLQSVLSGFKKSKGFLMLPFNYEQYAAAGGTPKYFYPYLNTKVSRMTIKPNPQNIKLVVFYTLTK